MSSKRYRKALELIDASKTFEIKDAIELLNQTPAVKFDETIEISAHLDVDPKHSDQMVRGTVALPHGSGKQLKVLAFTEDTEGALAAGADFAGFEAMIKKVQEGWLDFDIAVATPAAMKEVRNLARILGPKGLMPNPKAGTVSDDLVGAIKAVKAGRVEFKMNKTADVAIIVGKRSFTPQNIEENVASAMEALLKARPAACKTQYISSLTLSSTMSPGITLNLKSYITK